jgi:hypothetical protein
LNSSIQAGSLTGAAALGSLTSAPGGATGAVLQPKARRPAASDRGSIQRAAARAGAAGKACASGRAARRSIAAWAGSTPAELADPARAPRPTAGDSGRAGMG